MAVLHKHDLLGEPVGYQKHKNASKNVLKEVRHSMVYNAMQY